MHNTYIVHTLGPSKLGGGRLHGDGRLFGTLRPSGPPCIWGTGIGNRVIVYTGSAVHAVISPGSHYIRLLDAKLGGARALEPPFSH